VQPLFGAGKRSVQNGRRSGSKAEIEFGEVDLSYRVY
jgi:hypothetical protein